MDKYDINSEYNMFALPLSLKEIRRRYSIETVANALSVIERLEQTIVELENANVLQRRHLKEFYDTFGPVPCDRIYGPGSHGVD